MIRIAAPLACLLLELLHLILELIQFGLILGFLLALGPGSIKLILGRPVIATAPICEEAKTKQDEDGGNSLETRHDRIVTSSEGFWKSLSETSTANFRGYSESMRRIRTAIIGAAALCAVAVLPAVASADCTLTSSNNGDSTAYLSGGTTQTFTGHFGPAFNGKFIQIPFDVGSGITGMKIRYCFAKAAGGEADDSPTLDLGVYGARPNGATTWTQAERRGWSGSAGVTAKS